MRRLVLSISTLHRPEGLERILRSLASQERPEIDGRPLELSVVVVNNDPEDASPDALVRLHDGSPSPDRVASSLSSTFLLTPSTTADGSSSGAAAVSASAMASRVRNAAAAAS